MIENSTFSEPIKIPDKYDKKYSKSYEYIINNHEKEIKKDCLTLNDKYSLEKFIFDKLQYNNYIYYDAMNKCKSAGIIPYAFHNNKLYFLLQHINAPYRKKDIGWNDFGGKKNNEDETTAETAAREFSEETSCLFYLKENKSKENEHIYSILKNNLSLIYDVNAKNILKKIIPLSQKFYHDKIIKFANPIYLSSKETYISYLIKVEYISQDDIPIAEDIHIDYEERYTRYCKWFTLEELLKLNEKDFHKRLQITKIQKRIKKYYDKGLFI